MDGVELPQSYVAILYGSRYEEIPPLEKARQRDGCCLLGLYRRDGCVQGFDVHHIETRGSGGLDSLENLICLCRKHHQDVHAGRFSKEQLRWLLWFYYRYRYEKVSMIPRTNQS